MIQCACVLFWTEDKLSLSSGQHAIPPIFGKIHETGDSMVKLTINHNKKNGETYYYAQVNITRDGKNSTQTISVIGKHSDLLKITPDPEKYAKEIVQELDEKYRAEHGMLELKVDFDTPLEELKSVASQSTNLNVGYFFLQYIIKQLQIRHFVEQMMKNSKAKYNAYDILRFLVCARIIDPGSKLYTCQHLHNYFEKTEISHQQVLRFMDILAESYDSYIEHLFNSSCKIVKRNLNVVYYDCTNFYFEIECEDAFYVDEVTGEVIRGFRLYGPSKEHRPNPIVQMGLFMDSDGIPLSMTIHPGSTNEQITAIPGEKKIVKMFNGKSLIYCADGGLGSYNIRKYNTFGDRKFIVTQSIKKLSAQLQDAVFDNTDYRLLATDQPTTIQAMKSFDKHDEKNRQLYDDKIYKVIPADYSIELNGFYDVKQFKNGNTKKVQAKGIVHQYLIVTFSRKYFEYQRAVRGRQIEAAKRMLRDAKDPEEIKKGPNDVRRFIRLKKDKKINGSVNDIYEINTERIAAEEKYDGFYAIATNIEVVDSKDNPIKSKVLEVFRINDQRYKIEEDFRIMKTNFDGRPVYHRLPSRITAHFMICYTALMLYRLIEKQLYDKGQHFPINTICETLRNMQVTLLENKAYKSLYSDSEVLRALVALTDMHLDKLYYPVSRLKKIIRGLQ